MKPQYNIPSQFLKVSYRKKVYKYILKSLKETLKDYNNYKIIYICYYLNQFQQISREEISVEPTGQKFYTAFMPYHTRIPLHILLPELSRPKKLAHDEACWYEDTRRGLLYRIKNLEKALDKIKQNEK